MRSVSVHLISCVMLLGFRGCSGAGSSSGTAEFSLGGSKIILNQLEFLIEVNLSLSKSKVKP